MTTSNTNEEVGTSIFFTVGECSLGSVLVAQSARGVCSILIGEDPARLAQDLRHRFPKANLVARENGQEELVAQVAGLIEKPGTGLDLPLDVQGTAFARRVWRALTQLPPGSTATYGQIAQAIGQPTAARAVAAACAANPVALAIPCHRVVPAAGGAGGYRWGAGRKRALLAAEST
jgi:AraC family transcriptional regulator, regulatory protein of adaptative response / methylated-DNA-[protein]-cysteine methyltransferase